MFKDLGIKVAVEEKEIFAILIGNPKDKMVNIENPEYHK